jgi:hypothetical protein
MACTIAILDVVGQGQPGQPLSSIIVSGSATGCNVVSVTIVCIGNAVTHASVPVSGGAWQTTFTEQELKLAGCRECGNPVYPITVRVHCADAGSNCEDHKLLSEIPCSGAGCPTIEFIEAQIPSCGEVIQAGQWNVTFTATIVGSGVTVCLWNFGDSSLPVSGALPQGGTATQSHAYACAGEYPVSLTIFSDCQPGYIHSEVITLQLPTCGCPTVSSFEAHADGVNKCLWRFEAKIGGPFATCVSQFLWNFGDGDQLVTSVPQAEHSYDHDGSYVVTLTILGDVGEIGGGPCDTTTEIVVDCHHGGGGGDGDGDHPCPWWDPRCWKNPCKALQAAAIATLVTALVLFFLAGCFVLTPAVLAGPIAAAAQLLLSSALFIAAVAAMTLGLLLLALWYAICHRMPGYHFCHELKEIILVLSWIIAVQSVFAIAMALVGSWGCLIGLVLTGAYYGTVLAYLELLKNAAGCD